MQRLTRKANGEQLESVGKGLSHNTATLELYSEGSDEPLEIFFLFSHWRLLIKIVFIVWK